MAAADETLSNAASFHSSSPADTAGAGHANLQPDTWEPALADAVPLATRQSVLAGCAALDTWMLVAVAAIVV
jgi:hypothetical protein